MSKEMDNQDYSIEELAECVKELVRIFQHIKKDWPDHIQKRFEDVYHKASRAKNRVNGE